MQLLFSSSLRGTASKHVENRKIPSPSHAYLHPSGRSVAVALPTHLHLQFPDSH